MFDFPGSPTNGQVVTGPNGSAWSWDGVKWEAAIAGGTTIIVSDTPPANPTTGALWFDSVGAQTYLWFNDGTSSQWVPVNAPPSSSTQYLPISGGTMSGPLLLGADPATAMQAATKEYVDAGNAASENNTGRNLLHNAAFNVFQRGSGAWTASGNYTADRWQLFAVNDTVSVAVATIGDAGRATIGDESALYCLQTIFTGSATANSLTYIAQKVENVRRLSGKTVAISFWAMASSGTPRVAISFTQFFGTGGSPSGSVSVQVGATSALSSTWQRFTFIVTLPSAAGKTFGTTMNTDYTYFALWLSDQSNSTGIGVQSGTVTFWGVQLEYGNLVTPFAKRDPADDLAACQRFYQVSNGSWGGYLSAGSNSGLIPFLLPVVMRAAPTATFTPSGGGNYSATSVYTQSAYSISVGVSATAAGLTNFNFGLTASADL